MLYRIRILLICLLLTSIAYGQQTDVKFKITNSKNEAVAFATLRLLALIHPRIRTARETNLHALF